MKQYITSLAVATLLLVGHSGCSDFLSTLPDDRMEVNSTATVKQLLVSAYPVGGLYTVMAEMSSDNVQESQEMRSNTTRFLDQVFAWEDITETDNDSPFVLWSYHYMAINTANTALEALAKLPDTSENRALKGEALICRAYGHFVLANIFSMAYDPTTASNVLGVPYSLEAEKSVDTKYRRESLADNFAHIAADLEAGIPLLDDAIYTEGKKFHFTQKSAYALAARFYLYYQQWDKAIEYATKVIGTTPVSVLRNYTPIAALPSDPTSFNNRALLVADYDASSNLFFLAGPTASPLYFGPYARGGRYNHRQTIAANETILAKAAWWTASQTGSELKVEPVSTESDKTIYPRLPVHRKLLDVAQQTFVYATSYPEFTTDETLLVRAEAYINKGDYTHALADMNAWLSNATKSYEPLTITTVANWNTNTPYSTVSVPTPRKVLNATFALRDTQHEQFLQVLLHMRRIETLHSGLRWFDVKRYGIEIERYIVTGASQIRSLGTKLTARDARQALQLPQEVIAAGLEANKR